MYNRKRRGFITWNCIPYLPVYKPSAVYKPTQCIVTPYTNCNFVLVYKPLPVYKFMGLYMEIFGSMMSNHFHLNDLTGHSNFFFSVIFQLSCSSFFHEIHAKNVKNQCFWITHGIGIMLLRKIPIFVFLHASLLSVSPYVYKPSKNICVCIPPGFIY